MTIDYKALDAAVRDMAADEVIGGVAIAESVNALDARLEQDFPEMPPTSRYRMAHELVRATIEGLEKEVTKGYEAQEKTVLTQPVELRGEHLRVALDAVLPMVYEKNYPYWKRSYDARTQRPPEGHEHLR